MKTFLGVVLLAIACTAWGQATKPLRAGFDKEEYKQLLRAFSCWGDSTIYKGIPESTAYRTIYRSKVIGMENQWELYENHTHAVICLRGTANSKVSWMANFYAAMIPAVGQLQLNDTLKFDYHFANNPRAAVHVGWALSSAYLLTDILPKVREQYEKGFRAFMIFGHSQGAALAYLITAQLKHYQKTGVLPKDIVWKTYCSAAPKPGNLYFAYDYEASTQMGWSYSVVNAADWVPEVPVTIQVVGDFNNVNPFTEAKKQLRKLPFPQNKLMTFMHGQLTRPNKRALKKYQLYLGKIASRVVEKNVPGYKSPEEFYDSNNYMRCGNMIVLNPDEAYYQKFPDDKSKLFQHHSLLAYLYLLDKLPVE
ncbi:lipase family protein [Flavobacterium caeni]|uniref:Lipase (Class 3) n=1 Tax=Flavobacterium caeni TaxID=490189 RepID=A0A1G5JJ50_9FLAO|nr:lipase [Flavobacterium caeni]SCY87789.1 Lipase (class 3) [Flavobacterium caeni]